MVIGTAQPDFCIGRQEKRVGIVNRTVADHHPDVRYRLDTWGTWKESIATLGQ